MAEKKQSYEEWMKEDADRLNSLCESARKAGIVVDTEEGPPPTLNPDGSLKDMGKGKDD